MEGEERENAEIPWTQEVEQVPEAAWSLPITGLEPSTTGGRKHRKPAPNSAPPAPADTVLSSPTEVTSVKLHAA